MANKETLTLDDLPQTLAQLLQDEITSINLYAEALKIPSLPSNIKSVIEEIIEDEKDHAVLIANLTNTEITATFPKSGDTKTESWGTHVIDPYIEDATAILDDYASDVRDTISDAWTMGGVSHTVSPAEVAYYIEDEGANILIKAGYNPLDADKIVNNYLQDNFYSSSKFLESRSKLKRKKLGRESSSDTLIESEVEMDTNNNENISITLLSIDEIEGTKKYKITAPVCYDEDSALTARSEVSDAIDFHNEDARMDGISEEVTLQTFGAGKLTLTIVTTETMTAEDASTLLTLILGQCQLVWTDFE